MKVRPGKPSLQNSPQVSAQCGFVTGSLEGRALRPRDLVIIYICNVHNQRPRFFHYER